MKRLRFACQLLTVLLTIISINTFSQQNHQNQKPGQNQIVNIDSIADCNKALQIGETETFGPTTAPEGSGKTLEFSGNHLGNLLHIETEHNTAWYKIIIPKEETFTFEIIPLRKYDDYDFMLFQYTDSNFCSHVVSKRVKPIRTNIARFDTTINSKTGLSTLTEMIHKSSGSGESYSKAVNARQGDIFYLCVDNVYPNGEGHSIIFKHYNMIDIEGKVVDTETQEPVKAEIVWEDNRTGEVLATTTTELLTGKFKLRAPVYAVNNEIKYNLSFIGNENYFYNDTIISVRGSEKKPKITIFGKIERLIKGKNYKLNNINFYGDKAVVLPGSYTALRKIYKFMKRNKNLQIIIEGHTHGISTRSNSYHNVLSNNRAKTVLQYLCDNGIKDDRIETKGFGCSRMLYPNKRTEYYAAKNRRVEIKIINF